MLANRQVSKIIRHSGARVLEMNSSYVLVEKTGKTEDIAALYKEFVAEQCLLQYVKSGRVAITRDYNEDLSEQLFDEDAKRKGVKR
jgi:acetolactate synthase-1/3 small subunit